MQTKRIVKCLILKSSFLSLKPVENLKTSKENVERVEPDSSYENPRKILAESNLVSSVRHITHTARKLETVPKLSVITVLEFDFTCLSHSPCTYRVFDRLFCY